LTPHEPTIDVVIPVHTTERPLDRAVRSCFDGIPSGMVRVTVVCHNISRDKISPTVGAATNGTVRFEEFHDHRNSPAGPRNYGLSLATAPFVAVLDSDDYFETGALQAWHSALSDCNADAAAAPLLTDRQVRIRTPRVRPGRTHNLDPVRDGLAYTTAPLGLIRRETLESKGIAYTEGLRSGEDLDPGLRLWYSGAKIEYPAGAPGYVICSDASDRVTSDVLPLAEEFRAVLGLDDAWLGGLRHSARTAIAVKLVRVHLLGALRRRGADWEWTPSDLAALERFIGKVTSISGKYLRPFSMADRRLILAAGRASAAGVLREALEADQRAPYVSKVLAPVPWANLRRESTLRHLVRTKLYTAPLFGGRRP